MSEDDQKAEGVEEADIIKYNQEIKLFNTTDYMGKSKGLSMNYNRNMKLELFKDDGEIQELLETFTLNDVKEQYENELNYNIKQLEKEKEKAEAKAANQTEEEKAKDAKKEEEEEEDTKAQNPKVKLSIEFSRSGYLQLTKATVGMKERQ